MGRHDSHLPKKDTNRAVDGMSQKASGKFGQDVTRGQGQTTKQDAKDARQRGK